MERENIMSSPQNYLRKMVKNQREIIEPSGNYDKLNQFEMQRLIMNIHGDIFDSEICCFWKGEMKGKYCTVSFHKNKCSLLRLLLHNYIDHVNPKDKLEYLCDNKGKCCNLNHCGIKTS